MAVQVALFLDYGFVSKSDHDMIRSAVSAEPKASLVSFFIPILEAALRYGQQSLCAVATLTEFRSSPVFYISSSSHWFSEE